MKTAARLPALAILLMTAVGAQAEDGCDAPTGQWQSRDAVREAVKGRGWTVRRIKIDDGCYEIQGSDSSGKRFEARIDPVTLSILDFETRDHGHHHEDEQEAN